MVRMRLQGTAARKDYVEGLVRVELLAREGIRQGLQNDPDVVETVKKTLAQKTLQQTLEKNAPQPTDDEVKAWYDSHQADYQRPETGPGAGPLPHRRLQGRSDRARPGSAEAEKLRGKARALKPDDEAGFAALVKASSDDALTKQLGGDLRPMPAHRPRGSLRRRGGPGGQGAPDARRPLTGGRDREGLPHPPAEVPHPPPGPSRWTR